MPETPPPRRGPLFYLLLLAVPIALLALLSSRYPTLFATQNFRISRSSSAQTQNANDHVDIPPIPESPPLRHELNPSLSSSSTLRCFPSEGGIYITMSATPVDIAWLGLDRLNTVDRSWVPEEEDAFCNELRKVGAAWWEHEWDWTQARFGQWGGQQRAGAMKTLVLGWPPDGRGVWALRAPKGDAHGNIEGLGRVANALDMGEKCRAIEMCGGTFHKDPREVEELKDVKF